MAAMHTPKRLLLLSLLTVPLLALAEEAPDHPLLTDTFRFSLGGFAAQSTTQARLGTSTGGVGIDVDFESTLGLDERKLVGEANAYWRFGNRWRLDAGYFKLNRGASRTLRGDITWGDNTFTAGTTVDTEFDVSDLRAAVGYSFFRRQDKELGIAAGLHTLAFKAAISAAGVGGRSESVTAPLPVFALYGNFALTDRWALAVRTDWLSVAYDKYAGSIRSTAFDVVYQPWKHFALGFGMHNLTLSIDVDNPNSKIAARMVLQGPAAFASVSF